MLDIPGNNLANIFSIKNFPNAKEIFKALDDSTIKKVGIIGAGYIGVEIAEAIRKKGKKYIFSMLQIECCRLITTVVFQIKLKKYYQKMEYIFVYQKVLKNI